MSKINSSLATFEKGMWLDGHTSFQPEGTYPMAWNLVPRDEYQNNFKSNEHGTKKLVDLNDVIGDVYMKDTNETVFLKKTGELYLFNFDKEELHFIMSFEEFGCKMEVKDCEYVKMVYSVKSCDKYVHWSSNNVYYWVNISEMLNPKRKEILKQKLSGACSDCLNNCNYFKVFRPKSPPNININSFDKGGSLPAGTYVAVARLLNEDGTYTNWSVPSRTVHIGSEHNIPGEDGKGRVLVEFDHLDCNYNRIEIAIVYYDGSQITARTTVDYFSKSTYTFNYIELTGQPILVDELLLKSQINLEGNNLEHYDGVMYYFGIKPRRDYNVQRIADFIQVEWVAEKYSFTDAKKYNIKTIPFGETLAFGIVINHDDGTHSYVGHIRARGNGGSGFSANNPVGSISIKKNKKYKRKRGEEEDLVDKTYRDDKLTKVIDQLIQSYNTEIKDLPDIIAPACTEQGCNNPAIEEVGGLHAGGSGNNNNNNNNSNFQLQPRNQNQNPNLIFYNAQSCVDPNFTTVIASIIPNAVGKSIVVNGECFTLISVDNSNTDYYYGAQVYINCTQCLVFNGFNNNVSSGQGNNNSSGGGGGCSGGGNSSGGSCGGSGCCGGGSCNCATGGCFYTPNDCSGGVCKNGKVITNVYDDNGNLLEVHEKIGVEPVAEIVDELNSFCNVRKDQKDANIISKDVYTAEDILSKWMSILGDYIGDSQKKDLELKFQPGTIKEAAVELIQAVKRRERINEKKIEFNVNKSVSYTFNTIDEELGYHSIEPQLGNATYPGGIVVAKGQTTAKAQSRTYPCIRDCDGNLIYGNYTGQPITHHLFPDERELSYFESTSIGVPSKATPDADEYEGYGIYLGARFSNIIIDKEDYYQKTGKRVSETNPFTIVQAKLNNSNKTVLTKGLIHSNYISSNNGKEYDYQKHAVNSWESVNRYIDIDGSRLDPSPRPSDTVCMYSLDQAVLEPYIGSATRLKIVKRLSGIGYRHYLYREGIRPDNPTFGRREDQRGTVSATNLSQQTTVGYEYNIKFAKYVSGGINAVESPGLGGSRALINKYGQDCLWIGLDGIYSVNDDSFVGDVLNHEAPIPYAAADYAVLMRDLDDQYGALESISYIPILDGTSNHNTDGDEKRFRGMIAGLFGDRFIHPYSYVRTSYVSDRVGDMFPVGDLVEGKEDRCICDNPDDAVNSVIGKFIWTNLPKEMDEADAKNWAGTHTPQGGVTKTFQQALATKRSESEYYYPGTLTHLNTFVGESEANPYMRELSNLLEEQVYPYLRPEFHLHAVDAPWEKSYLSLFYIKNTQPSAAEKLLKVLMKSLVNLLLPMLKLEDLLSPEGTLDLAGGILSLTSFFAVWLLLSKVLLTDEFIDEFIGLPPCKKDEEGGIEFKVEKYFKNFNRYSYVFSKTRDLYQYRGMQEFTNCGCDQSTTHDIYVSDKQIENSYIDAFKSIRPNNYFSVNQSEGKLIDLFVGTNGGMFIHTTDGILILEQGRGVNSDNIYSVITGNINIIPRRIVSSTYEGYGGIASRHHAINSKYGRFFISYDTGDLYNFDGNSINPISLQSGATTLFKNYTKYFSDCDCKNNYSGCHYTLGIDPRFHRLLVTKVDGEYSWTISYDLLNRNFISFHSYYPKKYLFTSEDMYAISQEEVLYSFKKTQDIETKYNNYFDKQYGFSIDVKHTLPINSSYESHVLRTNVEKNDKGKLYKNIIETFDKIGFWNTHQTSGVCFLELYSTKERENNLDLQDNYVIIPVSFKNNEFRINELYDYTNIHGEALIEKSYGLPFVEPINYNQTITFRKSQIFKNRVLTDNMFYTRLIKDNMPDKKMYIKNIVLIYKENIA